MAQLNNSAGAMQYGRDLYAAGRQALQSLINEQADETARNDVQASAVQPDLESDISVSEKSSQDFDYEAFGKELDAIREEVLADIGQRDADYIRSIIRRQKYCEVGGRSLIHFSLNPITWAVGVGMLSVSKILENMEIGHNVMHGQYDWMNDLSSIHRVTSGIRFAMRIHGGVHIITSTIPTPTFWVRIVTMDTMY